MGVGTKLRTRSREEIEEAIDKLISRGFGLTSHYAKHLLIQLEILKEKDKKQKTKK